MSIKHISITLLWMETTWGNIKLVLISDDLPLFQFPNKTSWYEEINREHLKLLTVRRMVFQKSLTNHNSMKLFMSDLKKTEALSRGLRTLNTFNLTFLREIFHSWLADTLGFRDVIFYKGISNNLTISFCW